jgi:hypothetical protein
LRDEQRPVDGRLPGACDFELDLPQSAIFEHADASDTGAMWPSQFDLSAPWPRMPLLSLDAEAASLEVFDER